jgi:hypothetical protein
MFYYYGRKKQLAHLYPEPKHDLIVEPFAGSAAYSLYGDRWRKDVFLYDLSQDVVDIWKYLLSASLKDLQKLPDLKEGDLLDNFSLSREERLLISFHIRPGAVSSRNKVGRFSRWATGKHYICHSLYKIKHWKIFHGDYKLANHGRATYFLDPPYRESGKHYTVGSLAMDYSEYASWVLGLSGQIIACEGSSHCQYLPFKKLGAHVRNGGMNFHKKKPEYVFVADQ